MWDQSTLTASGLLRQADGAFTKETYNINLNQPAKKGSIPNFQQSFFNCVGLTGRTRTPGSPKLGVDPVGVGSTNPVTVDLTGTGVPSVAGIWQTFAPNSLVVGLLNGDLSAKSTVKYPVGLNPATVLAGDFNGDGKHDIAVIYFGPDDGSAPGGVSLLIGNFAAGSLKTAVNYPTGASASKPRWRGTSMAMAAPISQLRDASGHVVILLGNADGTLSMRRFICRLDDLQFRCSGRWR